MASLILLQDYPPVPMYTDRGVVKGKYEEIAHTRGESKYVLEVNCKKYNLLWKVYVPKKVFEKYGINDRITFRWPSWYTQFS